MWSNCEQRVLYCVVFFVRYFGHNPATFAIEQMRCVHVYNVYDMLYVSNMTRAMVSVCVCEMAIFAVSLYSIFLQKLDGLQPTGESKTALYRRICFTKRTIQIPTKQKISSSDRTELCMYSLYCDEFTKLSLVDKGIFAYTLRHIRTTH